MATKKPTRSIEERREAAEQLHQRLVDQVASLADSGQWQRFLDLTSAFHSYSLNNTMLIWSQHPTASRVAGYRQWEKLGRHVRRGEKAIKILATPPRRPTRRSSTDTRASHRERTRSSPSRKISTCQH
jgi:antirestriction protein ArdC